MTYREHPMPKHIGYTITASKIFEVMKIKLVKIFDTKKLCQLIID